jgi:hypothetical protein
MVVIGLTWGGWLTSFEMKWFAFFFVVVAPKRGLENRELALLKMS